MLHCTLEIGKAAVIREGTHVTIPVYGAMVPRVLRAAEEAAKEGIETEVIDLRSLVPLDEETLLQSVQKTGRMVVVHEAPRTGGFGGELAAIVAEKAILSLEAPILRVTGYDTPFPYTLEQEYLPSVDRIVDAVRETLEG